MSVVVFWIYWLMHGIPDAKEILIYLGGCSLFL